MNQLSFFDPPPHNGTPTSREAAAAIEAEAPRLRRQVLEAIQAAGAAGLTDEQIQAATHLEGNTERPRRRELEKAGAIRASGQCRPTASGRKAVVWVAEG